MKSTILKRRPTLALVHTHKKCFKKLMSDICCVKNNFNELDHSDLNLI